MDRQSPQWDDGDTIYFENTTTNTSGATIQYTWDWGDGSSDDVINSDSVAGGVGGGRIAHTFALVQNKKYKEPLH